MKKSSALLLEVLSRRPDGADFFLLLGCPLVLMLPSPTLLLERTSNSVFLGCGEPELAIELLVVSGMGTLGVFVVL
jgi:hypothetical protein